MNLHNELQEALTRAAVLAMTRRGGDLPALHWAVTPVGYRQWQVTGTVESGTPGVEGIVAAWGACLALGPVVSTQPGTVEARGDVDGVLVEVWGVVDRDAWNTGVDQP